MSPLTDDPNEAYLVLSADERAKGFSVLPNGTSGGKPAVAIRGKLDDGTEVVLQMTWNLLYTAARAISARYGTAQ